MVGGYPLNDLLIRRRRQPGDQQVVVLLFERLVSLARASGYREFPLVCSRSFFNALDSGSTLRHRTTSW